MPDQQTAGAEQSEQDETQDQPKEQQEQQGQQPEAKYTDADVDDIVKKRLARDRARIERDIRKQIEDEAANEQTEAQRLESMTELQRAKYEAEKLKAEKEALEAERDLAQQTAIARRELEEADIVLGDDLLSMFVSSDADATGAAIARIKEIWPKAVNDAVQKQLRREPPKADQPNGGMSFGAEFAEKYSKSKNGGK